MSKIKNFILFGIMALLAYSCLNKKEKKNIEQVFSIHIESKNILMRTKLSDFVSYCKYLPLETNSECLIGQLNKVDFFENDIFVLDTRSARSVYRFSSEGKFLNQIASRGRGPGEYFDPSDISIKSNTAEITILDRDNIQVLFYKPENTYLRSIKIPVYAYKLAWYDNDKMAVYSDKNEDLVLLDEKGIQIGAFFKNGYVKKMVMNYPFQSYKENLLYLAYMDYTIYKISENKVTPHVKFVFDKKMYKDKDIGFLMANQDNNNYLVEIKYYSENSSHIFMVYLYNRSAYMVIYNKLNSKTNIIDVRGIQNDITFADEPPIIMGVTPDDDFVAYFEYVDVSEPNELKKKIGTPADKLNEMSNPILLFLNFK